MDVWFTQNVKRAVCVECHKEIVNKSPMVVGRVWKRATGEVKKWSMTLRWHPECYLKQGISYVEQHPKVESRGRHSLAMDAETKSKRFAILRRRASVVQRVRREAGKPEEMRSSERLIHLGSMLNQLEEEMATCGGVPKSWE